MWKQSWRILRQLLHTHSDTDLRQQHTRARVLALTSKTGPMDVTLHRHVCPAVEDVFNGFGSFFSPSWSEEAVSSERNSKKTLNTICSSLSRVARISSRRSSHL